MFFVCFQIFTRIIRSQQLKSYPLSGLPEEMEEDELEVVVSESESVAASEQNGGRQQAANPFYAQPGDPANGAGRISAEDLTVLKGRFPHLADFFGFLPDVSHYRRIAAYRIHK